METIKGLLKLHDHLAIVLIEAGRTRLREPVHFRYGKYVYQINQDTPYYALKRLMKIIYLFREELKNDDAVHREVFRSEMTEMGQAIRLQHDQEDYCFYRFHENSRTAPDDDD